MIACTRGRAEDRRNYLFLFQEARAREQLRENTVRAAAVAAAQDLVGAVGRRLTTTRYARGGQAQDRLAR